MEFTIRSARAGDVEAIARFNQAMALETEGRHLPLEIVSRGVAAVIGDSGRGFYRVAEWQGEVIGQLMVTKEWSDWRDGWIWWIQSVYVQNDYRRKGVFRQLFKAVEQEARGSADVVEFRLYVERENRDAQKVYLSLGMHDTGYLVFEKPVRSSTDRNSAE